MYFYTMAWFLWIVTTFMLRKGKLRFIISMIILLMIITSQITFSIYTMTICVSGLLLCVIGVYLLMITKASKIASIFYCGIVAMIYSMIYFMEIYDPQIILVHRTLFFSFILSICCYFCVMNFMKAIGIFFVGTFQGECLLSLSLKDLQFHNDIATVDYLNIVAVGFVFMVCLYELSKKVILLNHLKHKQMKGMKEL
jgi:hypothetical protein